MEQNKNIILQDKDQEQIIEKDNDNQNQIDQNNQKIQDLKQITSNQNEGQPSKLKYQDNKNISGDVDTEQIKIDVKSEILSKQNIKIKNNESEISLNQTISKKIMAGTKSFITDSQIQGYGNIITNKPLRILKHRVKIDKKIPNNKLQSLYFKVEFEELNVKPIYYQYETLRNACPQILCDYYANNAVLHDNTMIAEKKEEY